MFQKINDIFFCFLLYFNQHRFVFLYCKDTSLVLKNPVFGKTKK